MKEKEKLPTDRECEKIQKCIPIIRGLISYHKRMVLPLKEIPCTEGQVCPVLEFENDLYLEALELSLVLLEREALNRGR